MDYEKAYKAVLKTATQWIKDGCTEKEKICLKCVFPELRESEEQPSEDVEEAAEKFAHFYDQGTCDGIAQDCFKAGAEWQKGQMLKDAVEGFIFQSADYYPKQLIAGYEGDLGMGDKVRIIIVKEGQQ